MITIVYNESGEYEKERHIDDERHNIGDEHRLLGVLNAALGVPVAWDQVPTDSAELVKRTLLLVGARGQCQQVGSGTCRGRVVVIDFDEIAGIGSIGSDGSIASIGYVAMQFQDKRCPERYQLIIEYLEGVHKSRQFWVVSRVYKQFVWPLQWIDNRFAGSIGAEVVGQLVDERTGSHLFYQCVVPLDIPVQLCQRLQFVNNLCLEFRTQNSHIRPLETSAVLYLQVWEHSFRQIKSIDVSSDLLAQFGQKFHIVVQHFEHCFRFENPFQLLIRFRAILIHVEDSVVLFGHKALDRNGLPQSAQWCVGAVAPLPSSIVGREGTSQHL